MSVRLAIQKCTKDTPQGEIKVMRNGRPLYVSTSLVHAEMFMKGMSEVTNEQRNATRWNYPNQWAWDRAAPVRYVVYEVDTVAVENEWGEVCP